MAVLKNKGLAKFYAYIIIYINANLKVSHVADKSPGTERCALWLWHPDFDNDNFGQIPMGGDELRENSIVSLRIRADEALRISVVCKLQTTELRRDAFLSEVVLREAAGGRFLLKTGFPTGASTALPAYLLSEVFNLPGRARMK